MKIAVCVVVKNEEKILAEWISFYVTLGFDTVIIIDDHSADDTPAIARRAAIIHDVRVLPWLEVGKGKQGIAYTRIVEQFKSEFEWIAFVDVDEFLVPAVSSSIQELLADRPPGSAIAVPWLMFGSSGHVEKPSGLTISDYTRRAQFSFGPNLHVKSIVQPKSVVRGVNPHYFEIDGQYYMPDSTKVEWARNSTGDLVHGLLNAEPSYSGWRLHHYFTRSKSHWEDRMARGQLGAITRTRDDFVTYDRNDVLDESALPFSARVAELSSRIALPSSSRATGGLGNNEAKGEVFMQPAMLPSEIALFKAVVSCSANYVEFGSGGSSVVACNLVAKTVISIDSSLEWLEKILLQCERAGAIKPQVVLADIGPVKELGYPLGNDNRHLWENYHTSIWSNPALSIGDTYLIDGRFRVACFLQTLLHCNSRSLIFIHDFAIRPEYHVVRKFVRELACSDNLSLFQKEDTFNAEDVKACIADFAFDPR